MSAALVYHDVVAPEARDAAGFPGPVAGRYKLAPDGFEAHLDALQRSGVAVGLIVPGRPRPPVALTFDDGGASALDVAGRLEARGWRGHFFVTTARTGTPGFLDADGVRELAARGHVVGSHGHDHPTYMGALSTAELTEQWRESRARLRALLGGAPDLAAVPGGFLSRAVLATAEAAGYRVLMTSQPRRRAGRHGALEVCGRYTIWATTPASTAAAYARGARPARARLWVEWELKGLAKRASPGAYERLRRVRAAAPASRAR